ncbi:MAG: ribonucleoside-diphosphate reductase, partial [Actinomycetota bacterium]|nr:ribonucleoside-diphosphate reductase [Actinomycetota bacterium]
FIWCKAIEERKARALRDAGFDMDLDGKDSYSIQYQNANNSVRLSDEFMVAVRDDADWHLKAVTTGETLETVKARDLFAQIAKATWECADPGVQFDTTINRWHTLHATGRINGSNPCFTGDSLVHTDKGLIRFDALLQRAQMGETFGVYTHDATNLEAPAERLEITSPEALMITGLNEIVRLEFDNGMALRCTANHKVFTVNRGYVPASELTAEDEVKVLDLPAPAVNAERRFPVSTDVAHYRRKADHAKVNLPEKWSPEFAHYVGWLIGDGCISSTNVASTIYGSPDDREHVLPRHMELLTEICQGAAPKPSVQANGTVQLRLGRGLAVRFLEALGVGHAKAPEKTVPWSIQEAPADILAAFLQGLFDADGCVYDGKTTRYVGLGSASRELLQGVQRLLTTFGISSRIFATQKDEEDKFFHVRQDGTVVICPSKPTFDLRVSGANITRFEEKVGFSLPAKAIKLDELLAGRRFHACRRNARLVERYDDGVELTYNLCEPRNHSYVVNGCIVMNCSEYLSVDNSACNLASLNLLRYLEEGGTFDVEGFKASVEVLFTAQEILVGMSDYPTQQIGKNAKRFRQLGIGYANLGALLMSQGMAYDSDDGRAYAAAVTALMTGQAYATSARTAARMGPFAGYTENAEHMLRVLRMHRDEVAKVDEEQVPTELLSAAQEVWDHAVEEAERFGVRNSQASVLAPTGTISFLLDCDTTGVEPDLGLVKMKKLVGGGTMSIVNHTVPRALRKLGYSDDEVAAIVGHIDEHKTIMGAPALKPEHLPVFACSMGDNVIHYSGHVRMMAAVQPFISGALSKTVNVPEEATVEDIEQLYLDSWRMGIKALAVYRDNCKVAQPLSTVKKGTAVDDSPSSEAEAHDMELALKVAELEKALDRQTVVVKQPIRERLPRRRRSPTIAFREADCEGYVTVGEYDDGRPGEVFVKVSKQGSTLAGVMDAFSISISLGLQHGVPLKTYVQKYTNMRFEPAGMTDDPDLRIAASLMDYIFRRLAVDYLPVEERADLGILTTEERTQPTLPGVEEVTTPTAGLVDAPRSESTQEEAARAAVKDAPFCYPCGVEMQRAGSCYACGSCGTTSGCS